MLESAAVKTRLCKVALDKPAAVKGNCLKIYPAAIGRGDYFLGIGRLAYFLVALQGEKYIITKHGSYPFSDLRQLRSVYYTGLAFYRLYFYNDPASLLV